MKLFNSKLLPIILMTGIIGSYSSPRLTSSCTPCGGGSSSLDGEVEETAGNCDPIWNVEKKTVGVFFEQVTCKTGGKNFCPKIWHLLFPCPTPPPPSTEVEIGD